MSNQEREKTEIIKPKLLLVEGKDAYLFCIQALKAYMAEDVQVMNFGGISQLRPYLKTLVALPHFDKVTTMIIARDAETRPTAAVTNIKKVLKETGMAVPAKPFMFSGQTPRVAFMLFPGFNGTDEIIAGTLEDLCVQILKDNDVQRQECAREYLFCLEENGKEIKWPHKSFLHTYFAGENRYVGMKIGEASKAGAWNWEHEKLLPFKKTIMAM